MKIRKATERDLDRIYEITVLAFGPYCLAKLREDRYGTVNGVGWDVHKGTSVRSSCAQLMGRVFVAEADDRVVGYSSYHVDKPREIGEIEGNAVDPAYQGRGLGTRLVGRAVAAAAEEACVRILYVATMLHDKPARRVYEKQGFRELCRSVTFTARNGELNAGSATAGGEGEVFRAVHPTDADRIGEIAASAAVEYASPQQMEARHGPIGGKSWRNIVREEAAVLCRTSPPQLLGLEARGRLIAYGGLNHSAGSQVARLLYPTADPAADAPSVGRGLLAEILRRTGAIDSVHILSVNVPAEDEDALRSCESAGFREISRGIVYSMSREQAIPQ